MVKKSKQMGKINIPIIAIVGNVALAKCLSELFTNEKTYFALMEEPWVERPDATNEVIRRTNLLAKIPHENLIIAGCSDKTLNLIDKHFPPAYKKKVILIKNEDSLEEKIECLSRYRSKNRITPYITQGDLCEISASEKIAVIEQSGSIGEVIAESFCISHGYKIMKVLNASKETVDEYEELLRQWNCDENDLARAAGKEGLFTLLRGRVGILEKIRFKHIIFFTRGIPYGILPFESPVTHLFMERDLGIQILRGYVNMLEKPKGISLAIICDPAEIPDTESSKINDIMIRNGVNVIYLHGKGATSHKFQYLISYYPYDFAMISSHAGEISGRRITEEFINSKGNKYTVIYDLFATFAPIPHHDKIPVFEMTVPVSINGISWTNKNRLELDPTQEDFDLKEFSSGDRQKRKILSTEECKKIKFSNALKLNDFEWIPAFHAIADTRYPVIFNNACSSWIEMAGNFMFAGAVVYIGTTKDINTSLAVACGSRAIEIATKRQSLLYSVFQAQKQYVDQLGYSPYLYWGYPDASLRPSFSNNGEIKKTRLINAVRSWQRKGQAVNDTDMQKKISVVIDCLREFI